MADTRPDDVFTDGLGKYRFDFPDNDYRIPGSAFEVCEDDDVDGWLPHTPTCQIVKLPMMPGACVRLWTSSTSRSAILRPSR